MSNTECSCVWGSGYWLSVGLSVELDVRLSVDFVKLSFEKEGIEEFLARFSSHPFLPASSDLFTSEAKTSPGTADLSIPTSLPESGSVVLIHPRADSPSAASIPNP